MRILLLLMVSALVARAEDKKPNPEVVKAVRAALSAKKQKDIDSAVQAVLARKDLDWVSIKQGGMDGRYYQNPMSTERGERHSGKHMGLRMTGKDGKARGFSLWIPKSYDGKAKDGIPMLLYLHHDSYHPHGGAERAGVAVLKFREACEKHGVLFVAPYTSAGAEWWTAEGRRLVEWTLKKVKERYNVDENRIALMGAMDGAEAVWVLGQELPGTWSCLIPMTGDPYTVAALFRPLFLGSLDRMPVLMGVTGKYKDDALGDKDLPRYLQGLKPLFDQRMRITASMWPTAQGDFSYLTKVREQVMAFVVDKKRDALPHEVDIETDSAEGRRSLWLESHGVDPGGDVADGFKTTVLKWTPPERKKQEPKLGVHLKERKKWEVGILLERASGPARKENVMHGDVLLEVDDVAVKTLDDVKKQVKTHKWGDVVRILIAREVRESELETVKKRQAAYLRFVAKRAEYIEQDKPVPADLKDQMHDEAVEDEDDDEEDDDEDSSIEIGGDDDDDGKAKGGPVKAAKREKTVFYAFERFLHLRRTEGKLVRADFGATWDKHSRVHGVKLAGVVAGGRAHRAGLRSNDVIVGVGSEPVNTVRDVQAFFEEFKFEKAPEGERFVEFTVLKGGKGDEHTIHMEWEPVRSGRVDAAWNKKEKTLRILARHCKGFTVYFTDELIAPGVPFQLFINNIPYQDLVDPDSAPDYPHVDAGTDGSVRDEVRRMRRRRAKVDGWKPDFKWALDEMLRLRDRELVMGAKRSFDLSSMKKGFEAAKARRGKRKSDRGAKIKKSYEEFQSKG